MTTPAPVLPYVVFCDFDGTITAQETFVAILKQYAPELSALLMPKMYRLELTLREGVRQILESIPSAAYPEIVKFAATQPQRPGLPDLLTFLAAQHIPFVIVSGGLRGMVEAAIAPVRSQIHAVYGVDLDTQGAQFKVHSPVEGETELVSKVDIMRLHPAQCTIAIGDSVTDLNMALAADVVFARDRLAEYLGDRGVSFYRWDTFDDIRSILASQVLNA